MLVAGADQLGILLVAREGWDEPQPWHEWLSMGEQQSLAVLRCCMRDRALLCSTNASPALVRIHPALRKTVGLMELLLYMYQVTRRFERSTRSSQREASARSPSRRR